MNAITYQGKRNVKYESIPDPIVESPTDVIVQVEIAGICGSDLHPYHEREKGLDHGTAMGHEFVGKIIAVGSDVRLATRGDRVFSPFTTNCGHCFFCRKGLTCRCVASQLFGWVEQGIGLQGGQAELVRVPLADSTLLKIPDGVAPEEALLLGDICSTGFFCAENAEVEPGGVYAVVGCGPVGIMAIIGATELGAQRIFAVDSVPDRLELARKFGAAPLNYRDDHAFAPIQEATEGRGADAVLEVVGNAAAAKTAVELVRPGGIISTVGFHTEKEMAFSPGQAYDKNLTYKNGRCPARHYMERLVPMVRSKKYDLTSVISHRLTLSEGAKGYQIFDQKLEACMKVVLTP